MAPGLAQERVPGLVRELAPGLVPGPVPGRAQEWAAAHRSRGAERRTNCLSLLRNQ